MRVVSGGASLAVEVTGQSPTSGGCDVLLLHAGVTDRRGWNSVVEVLSGAHRCITFDARGYGETTYVPEDGWSPVADAIAVLDSVGADRVAVVGSSMGGQTAVDLVLGHPDRVAALVLIGPSIRGAPYPEPTDIENELYQRLEVAENAQLIDEINRTEAHIWLDGPATPEGRVAGPTRDLFLQMNGQALRATDPGTPAAPADAWSRLSQITVSTLVLVGDLDVSELQVIDRQAAALIPQARLVELAGRAHLPQLEDGSALGATVADSLAAVGR